MKTQFQLDNLETYRELDNYKVVDNSLASNNECIVCFSSNGLYYPNTNDNLKATIESDKYEWQKIINTGYKRIIYIRDIYKQWYVEGISQQYNSVDKVKGLLFQLTKGYDCTFIGSSAGGYAAVLFGGLLAINKIMSFSGQFDIARGASCKVTNKIVHEATNTQYFDVSMSKTQVYYFFPMGSVIDQKQHELIKNSENIKVINIDSLAHGVPVFPFALKKIISLNNEQLTKLTFKTHNKTILSLTFMEPLEFLNYFLIKVKACVKWYR